MNLRRKLWAISNALSQPTTRRESYAAILILLILTGINLYAMYGDLP